MRCVIFLSIALLMGATNALAGYRNVELAYVGPFAGSIERVSPVELWQAQLVRANGARVELVNLGDRFASAELGRGEVVELEFTIPGLAKGAVVQAVATHGGHVGTERRGEFVAEDAERIVIPFRMGTLGGHPVRITADGRTVGLMFHVEEAGSQGTVLSTLSDDDCDCEGEGSDDCDCGGDFGDTEPGDGGIGDGDGDNGDGDDGGGEACDNEESDEDDECETSGGQNPFSFFSGNLRRTITDVELAVQVGEIPMRLQRTMTSRPEWTLRPRSDYPFGQAGNWRHSFHWTIADDGLTPQGEQKLQVIDPRGYVSFYHKKSPDDLFMTYLPRTQKRILPVGTNYFLLHLDGTRYHITESEENGLKSFRMEGFWDRYSNRYDFAYNEFGDLAEVRSPNTNHYFRFEYTKVTNSVSPGWVRFSFADPDATQVLLAGTFNNWRGDQNPMQRVDGEWIVDIELDRGFYEYKFVVQYPGSAANQWLSDPRNELMGGPHQNSIAVVDPFRVVSSVQASDGRRVRYHYDWSYNPEYGLDILLVEAEYEAESAYYSYYPAPDTQERKALPKTADDPHWRGPGRAVRYEYDLDSVYSGRIREEFSLVTGQSFGRVERDESDHFLRYYTDAEGNTRSVQFNSLAASPLVLTNAAGYVRRNLYHDGFQPGDQRGMLHKTIDASGQTSVISRTWYFGAITSVSNSTHCCSCSTEVINVYTDDTFPFYLASRTGRGGHTTRYMRDEFNRPVRIDYPDETYELFTYNPWGQVVTMRQRDGALRNYAFDERGRKISETDPAGAMTLFAYDDADRLISVTDPMNRITTYEYDWRGNRIGMGHPDGTSERWYYDRYGAVTQHVGRLGGITVTEYDDRGRIAVVRDPLQAATYTQRDTFGRILTITHPSGLVVSNTYDAIGRRTRETFPDGTFNEWQYEQSHVRARTDRAGNTTQFEYDVNGRLQRTIDPLGRITSYGYDDSGNRVAVTNDNGTATYTAYDAVGRVVTIANCNGIIVSNRYDGLGRLIERVDANSITNHYIYDAAGRLLFEMRNDDILYHHEYNAGGGLVSRMDGAGITLQYEHDAAGRVVRTVWPDLTYARTEYEGGVMARQIDRAGRVTTFERDVLGRVTHQVDHAGHSVSYVYDPAGNLVELRDQGGNLTRWAYDVEGRQVAKIYDDGSRHEYEYDVLGRMTARRDAMDRVTAYQYDAVGNLTRIEYPNDAPVGFEYDNLDRVARMVDAVGETLYTYATDCGLVETLTGPFGDMVQYRYDSGNRATNIAFQGLSRNYTWDHLNRLAGVNTDDALHEYEYVAASRRIAQLRRPGAGVTDYQYDFLGRLTHQVNRAADGSVLSSFAYDLDDADQRIGVTREDGFQLQYGYDDIGQLTSAAGITAEAEPARGWQFAYQYDERGNPVRREHDGLVWSNRFNRLNQQEGSRWSGRGLALGTVNTVEASVIVNDKEADVWSLEDWIVFGVTGLEVTGGDNLFTAVVVDRFGRSDEQTRVLSLRDREMEYDLNGNLLRDSERIYTWDDENRLVAVHRAETGQLLVQNRYDGLSRRRERVMWVDGVLVTNRYVYDGWLVVAVLDGNNEVIEQYTHGIDLSGTREGAGGVGGILSEHRPQDGTTRYYHYDGNGNVMTLTDNTGATVSRLEYDPFGQVLLTEGDHLPRFQFSTKEYDPATGLNYYGYRFYSPELGRWVNRDPIGEEGGMNLYGFVFNDPISLVDILGLVDINRPVPRGPFGCCGGQRFDTREQCCENNTPVDKEPVWICRRPLRFNGGELPQVGPLSHSYVACVDPALDPNTRERFGMQPRPGGEGGIWGPGYIDREPDDFDTDPADCRERRVCPREKERMCRKGETRDRYLMPSLRLNCHGWVAGRCR